MQERGSPCPRRSGPKSSRGKREQHVRHTARERVGPCYWQSNLSKVVWLKSSRVQDTPVPGRGEAGASREGWDLAPVSGRRAWSPPVLCRATAQTSKSQPTCRYVETFEWLWVPCVPPSHDSEAVLIKRRGGASFPVIPTKVRGWNFNEELTIHVPGTQDTGRNRLLINERNRRHRTRAVSRQSVPRRSSNNDRVSGISGSLH